MILKYFLPFCGLYFNFLDSVFFDAQKFLTVVKFIFIFLVFLVIWCYIEETDIKFKVLKFYPYVFF